MKNESEFLAEFYGPTLFWFGPIFGVMALIVVIGNLLMISIALSTPSIRSVISYWFIIGMGISDLISGLNSSLLYGAAYFCGMNQTCPTLVKICGAISFATVEISFVFPTFITINRYFQVSMLPSDESRFSWFIVSKKAILLLTLCACTYVITTSSIMIVFDGFGEDPMGFYCAKRFTSFWLYLIYMTGAFYAVLSYLTAYIFYGKLQKFIAANVEMAGSTCTIRQNLAQENNDTISVMKMVKLATLIPLFTQTPGFLLEGVQWEVAPLGGANYAASKTKERRNVHRSAPGALKAPQRQCKER
uniref:G-protein coupled receptors family 1 profile domain-containing protein n=1 Tax=Plectus sambesii TaxID=2011161 RepID=A0A914UPD5_9BILA